jgi:hypothetical protein
VITACTQGIVSTEAGYPCRQVSYFAELHAAMRSNADPAEVKRIQDAYGIVRS